MWQVARNALVKFGNNIFYNTPTLVAYEGNPLLSVTVNDRTQHLGVDCLIFDSDGNKLATVKHNNIYADKYHKKQYTIGGNADRFTLTHKQSEETLIDIRIRREAEPMNIIVCAKLYTPDGVLFEGNEEEIIFGQGSKMIENTFTNLKIGVNLRKDGSVAIGVN